VSWGGGEGTEHQMTQGGRGSKIGQKSVTYYLNGLSGFILRMTSSEVNRYKKINSLGKNRNTHKNITFSLTFNNA
jgi:hypothetical protein